MIVSSCDGPRCRLGTLEFALGVLIPEVVAAILPICGECVELLVEGQPIDGINLDSSRVVVSMALETEIIGKIRLILLKVYILNSASSLD